MYRKRGACDSLTFCSPNRQLIPVLHGVHILFRTHESMTSGYINEGLATLSSMIFSGHISVLMQADLKNKRIFMILSTPSRGRLLSPSEGKSNETKV